MRSSVLLAAPLLASCSLLYDADGLRVSDAGIADAPGAPDARSDANPALLTLTAVEPARVAEGLGATGRAVPLVLGGDSLVGSAVVRVGPACDADSPDAGAGDAGAMPVPVTLEGPVRVADDGTLAAVAMRVAVLEDLPAGDEREVGLIVEQGTAVACQTLIIEGLGELTLSGSVDTDSTELAPRYARVEIAAGVHASGSQPLVLSATGEIVVNAALDADASGTTPGAHGCAGGDGAGAVGGCGDGGGGGATNGGLARGPGGGGGGHAAMGGDGQGGTVSSPAGAGGTPTGSEMLVPIASAPGVAGNRGNGGGAGGTGTLVGAPGDGGGGGGVVSLTSDGVLRLAAPVRANGADGAAGSSNGGGGGGGSGGTILLRAAGGIEVGGGAVVEARGGAGGPGGGGSQDNAGGPGSTGRIRIDAPDDAWTQLATGAVAGPTFAVDTPVVVDGDGAVDVVIHGEPFRVHALTLGEAVLDDVTIGAGGTRSARVMVPAGLHRMCAFAGQDPAAIDEARMCIDIAHVPTAVDE